MSGDRKHGHKEVGKLSGEEMRKGRQWAQERMKDGGWRTRRLESGRIGMNSEVSNSILSIYSFFIVVPIEMSFDQVR